MFAMFICVYMCFLHAAYMQMSANWCKCMLHCTSPTTFAPLYGANSISLALYLAPKTSVLTFVRLDPYT